MNVRRAAIILVNVVLFALGVLMVVDLAVHAFGASSTWTGGVIALIAISVAAALIAMARQWVRSIQECRRG